MIPETFPVLTPADIFCDLESYYADEFDMNAPCTTCGWLQRLFLFGTGKIYEYNIQDIKDYTDAIDTFRSVNKIPKKTDLEEWEDNPKNTKAKQAAALNKLRIHMGYTEEYYATQDM